MHSTTVSCYGLLTLLFVTSSVCLKANRGTLNNFVINYDPELEKSANESSPEDATSISTVEKITSTHPSINVNLAVPDIKTLTDLESRIRHRAGHYAQAAIRMTKYRGKKKPSVPTHSVTWESRKNLTDEEGPTKLVCYYNVPHYNDRPFAVFPEQIDPLLCTHIIIGFAWINNSSLEPSDERDLQFYNRTIALKQRNPELKVMLVIGGANDHSFPAMVSTNGTRAKFIESCAEFLRQYKFDGLDFDWEFPAWQGQLSEKDGFLSFLKEIRNFSDKNHLNWLLSVAVAAPQPIVDVSYDIKEMGIIVDFINLMAYDFHFYSPITPFTGPNAPLKAAKEEIGAMRTMNTEWAAKYWYVNGMPANKIVVGIPTYGHTFKLLDNREKGYWSLADGPGSIGSQGYSSYPETCDFIAKNGTNVVYDEQIEEPYASNNLDWISFDNERSGKAKAEWIKGFRLGGAMIYCINTEDAWKMCNSSQVQFPIINAVKAALMP